MFQKMVLVSGLLWIIGCEISRYFTHRWSFEKPFLGLYLNAVIFSLFIIPNSVVALLQRHTEFDLHAQYTNDHSSSKEERRDSTKNIPFAKLSSPKFVPTKFTDPSDGCDSDDTRCVRFKGLVEVRHMSDDDALDSLLARLSYESTNQLFGLNDLAQNNNNCKTDISYTALHVSILWFISEYLRLLGLDLSKDYPDVRIFYPISMIAGTIALSYFCPHLCRDKFKTSTVFFAAFVIISAMFITQVMNWTDGHTEIASHFTTQFTLFTTSGLLCSAYVILMTDIMDKCVNFDLFFMLGNIGVYGVILAWPGFFILSYTKTEVYEFGFEPSRDLPHVANVISHIAFPNLLWLCGCVHSSAIIGGLTSLVFLKFATVFDWSMNYNARVISDNWLIVPFVAMTLAYATLLTITLYPHLDPFNVLPPKRWQAWKTRQSGYSRQLHADAEQLQSLMDFDELYEIDSQN